MTVINTYNESSLHRTLKKIYASEFDGQTEVKYGPYICDIITGDSKIIEIQTSNISALKRKIEFAIENNRKITVVHPVIETKTIETFSPGGKLLSRRKSPKSDTVYSALRGLTGIHSLLASPWFTLEIIGVSITEIRIRTGEKVQTLNKSRHHLRNWLCVEKKLISINTRKKYSSKEDFKSLLPVSLPDKFTPPQVYKAMVNMAWPDSLAASNIKSAASKYTLLIWLLEKMQIIKKTDEKKGKSWIYKRT